MLLSEAIRLGAMLGPQCFDEFHNEQTDATCALGAAFLALGTEGSFFGPEWCLGNIPADCPQCRHKLKNSVQVITHLNDYHRWSRSAIADWVETLEVKLGLQESKHPDTQGVVISSTRS